MKGFRAYQHVERFGNSEVEGILDGKVYVFPKIDGTNASVWCEDAEDVLTIQAGSRKRLLSIDNDNAGFCSWVSEQENIKRLLASHDFRLYGEWLVPHALRTYKSDAWHNFYVFDVMYPLDWEGRYEKHLSYDDYEPVLAHFGVKCIPPLAVLDNPSEDDVHALLAENKYLIDRDKGAGEGIVLKRYDFLNRYNRTTWAKIVTKEFKEKHKSSKKIPLKDGERQIEAEIVAKYITISFCEKEKAKIELDAGEWRSQLIPRLLGVCWHNFVTEDLKDVLKSFRNPTINFKILKTLVEDQIKKELAL